MKLIDLIKTCTSEVWITFDEDPNRADWNIKLRCHSEIMEDEMLAQWILDSEVHLLTAKESDVIFVSIFDSKK